MTDADEDFTPPAPRSRLRWLRRIATWLVGALAVVALVLFVSRWQVGRLGEQRLRATTQRLDASEPDWRLDAILDERKKHAPPPNEDAAPLVLELVAKLPKEWNESQTELDKSDWSRPYPYNNRLADDTITKAGKIAEPTRLLRERALQLRNTRGGIYPLTINEDPIATLLPHIESARRVVMLLEYDARWETLRGNPNRGIASARAGLAVARSIGDEPFLISQLVRIACAKTSAQAAMQTLAWGEPTEGLAELQAELLAEAEVPWFSIGMRGERAALDRVFEGLQNGTISPKNCFSYLNVENPGPEHYAAFRAYKSLLPGDRAKCLELCTRYLEASKRPPHEQLAALKAIERPKGPPDEFRYLIARMMLPACDRVAESGLRGRASLLTAATGVACERYRRKHGRFPHDLAALVPEFLPAVPVDPFEAAPLRYRVYPDRVAVYCFWTDATQRHEVQPEEVRDGDAPGLGIGYVLWKPEQRGLPAIVIQQP